MVTAGVDCGAGNTKTVILRDGRIIGRGTVPTGFDPGNAAARSLELALGSGGVSGRNLRKIGGTGSGSDSIPTADVRVDDIQAMAKAARFLFSGARTVIDVGAEEGRAVRIDDSGHVVDFVVNEKCAAGAGAFIEAMARALDVSVEEMGTLCLQSDRPGPMNAQCVVFAESEVVGLIHSRTPKQDISRAVHDALAVKNGASRAQVGVLGQEDQALARHDLSAEFHVFHAAEAEELVGVNDAFEVEGADLGGGFAHDDARHERPAGDVAFDPEL